jgi:1-acyl-sn-glycerol-3-phosphate acyltransferase
MKPTLLYRFLKVYCTVGLWFYIREWRVTGKNNIPAKGPVLFIANHQNAFLDAIIMTCSTSLTPYYLARANVFAKKWAAQLLASINIMPVYRIRDGFGTLKNNDAIFQQCIDLLKKKESVLLFPEANHNPAYTTRDFQKGFARIALLYYKQTGRNDLRILPATLYFTEHHAYQTSVLLQLQPVINPIDYMGEDVHEKFYFDEIKKVAEHAVNDSALILPLDDTYYETVSKVKAARPSNLHVEEILDHDKKNLISRKIDKNKKTTEASLLKIVFSSIWKIYHFLPVLVVRYIIKKKIKDDQFISSVTFAIGIFLVPVYYVGLSAITYLSLGNSWLSIIVAPTGVLLSALQKFFRYDKICISIPRFFNADNIG